MQPHTSYTAGPAQNWSDVLGNQVCIGKLGALTAWIDGPRSRTLHLYAVRATNLGLSVLNDQSQAETR